MVRAYQPTAGLTTTCSQIEAKVHSASLRVKLDNTSGHPTVLGSIDQDYHLKSVIAKLIAQNHPIGDRTREPTDRQ